MADTTVDPEVIRDHMISNKVYDRLKPFVTMILPGLGTLYFALSDIWNLPYGKEIVGTIAAVATFLGIILKISSSSYDNSEAKYDGTIDVMDDPGGNKKTYSLNLNSDPEHLDDKSEVKFKVNPL